MRGGITWLVLAAIVFAGGLGARHLLRPEVSLVSPHRGPSVRAVYATGVVEPETWAAVAPLQSGRIASIHAYENQEVVSGAPLARLDDQEAKAIVEELEASKGFLELEVARTRKLLAKSITSEKAHQRAVSEYQEIIAAIAAAKARRDYLTLRAPISGQVLRRDGEVGEVVERGQPVFWVGAPRPLRMEVEVDEEDIPLVAAGQGVHIKADAFPDRVLMGTVEEITPKGDPVTKSFRVRVALPDETPLMIGMTAETNIVVEKRDDTLLVPTSAVRKETVWTLEDGRAVPIAVRLGTMGNLETEIVSGLEDDRPIIVDPPGDIAEGDRYKVATDGP